MTITYYALEEAFEDPDVVLAALIDREWDDANTNNTTPEITDGGAAYTSRRTRAPRRSNVKDTITVNIIGHEPDFENRSSGNALVGQITMLSIMVQADSKMYREAYVREINRILLEATPNSAIRILKSNGVDDSHILYFVEPLPRWGIDPSESDILRGSRTVVTGVLGVRWALQKS